MPKVVVMSYYHYLLHNNPEDRSSHLLHGRSLTTVWTGLYFFA